ncbi:MAG: hypothetical protein HYZ29_25940 [Myxococcales bacterium]|nr:hypothetical protein [Myxococcales bacterium]
MSRWAVVSPLSIRFVRSDICLDYRADWPALEGVNANPWVFVKLGGTGATGAWHAGTWEWLRTGQRCKSVRSVCGDHIKVEPLASWGPRQGEQVCFMVSALGARGPSTGVSERTDVTCLTWPLASTGCPR